MDLWVDSKVRLCMGLQLIALVCCWFSPCLVCVKCILANPILLLLLWSVSALAARPKLLWNSLILTCKTCGVLWACCSCLWEAASAIPAVPGCPAPVLSTGSTRSSLSPRAALGAGAAAAEPWPTPAAEFSWKTLGPLQMAFDSCLNYWKQLCIAQLSEQPGKSMAEQNAWHDVRFAVKIIIYLHRHLHLSQ